MVNPWGLKPCPVEGCDTIVPHHHHDYLNRPDPNPRVCHCEAAA